MVGAPDDPAGGVGNAGSSGGSVVTVVEARNGSPSAGLAEAAGRVNHAVQVPASRAAATAAATLLRELVS
ncbi:MAG: hypothetical protein ABI112_11105, partial [Terracoccus sp.]